MSNLKDSVETLRLTTANEVLLLLVIFSSALASGLLPIWKFKPELLSELNTFLVILLSLSAALPVLTLNVILFINLVIFKHPAGMDITTPEAKFLSIAIGLLISMLVTCLPLLLSVLFSMNLHSFLWFLSALQLCVCILYLVLYNTPP
jgi:hypothetical protein